MIKIYIINVQMVIKFGNILYPNINFISMHPNNVRDNERRRSSHFPNCILNLYNPCMHSKSLNRM